MTLSTSRTAEDLARSRGFSGRFADNPSSPTSELSWEAIAAAAASFTLILLNSVIGSIVGGGVQAGAQVVGGVARTASSVARLLANPFKDSP